MKKDRTEPSAEVQADSTVAQIVRRAEAMGVDPQRVVRALGVPLPPKLAPPEVRQPSP